MSDVTYLTLVEVLAFHEVLIDEFGGATGVRDLEAHAQLVGLMERGALDLAALSAPDAAGKRLIGSGEDAVPMAHIAATLRAAGYVKAPKRRLRSAVLRLAGRFDAQARSFAPYLGTHASADASGTRAAVGWSAGPIEPGLLELADRTDRRRLVERRTRELLRELEASS